VAEVLECFRDISRHGYVDRAMWVKVVPGEGYAAVHVGLPFSGEFLVGFQCAEEVFCIIFINVLDGEVVHD
jgi:hypothetical protein